MEPNAQQNIQQQSPAQAGEEIGMSKSFSENPSMEMLNKRRIDQIVSAREQERARTVAAVQEAQTNGVNQGIIKGREEGLEVGFIKGHMDGQNYGKPTLNNNIGLGSSIPMNQQQMQ